VGPTVETEARVVTPIHSPEFSLSHRTQFVGPPGQHHSVDDVFIGSEALAKGVLTRGQLRWNFRPIFPYVYMHAEATPSLPQRAFGAWLWSGRRAVIGGLTAAALHNARWISDSEDVEVLWGNSHPPRGIVARNARIESDEIVDVAGLPITTPERTALDIARHHPRDIAVARLDPLASATGITTRAVQSLVARYEGTRHWWRAVESLSLMDGGSHTPYETMVRLELIDSGLPAPRTQFTVTDGGASAVLAMGYEAPKVAVEFDSVTPEFVQRQGWTIVRASHAYNKYAIAYLVRAAVIEAGWRYY